MTVVVWSMPFCILIQHPADYPSNQQFIKHFGEFVKFGYKPHLGCVETKFPFKDGTRVIQPHSVGIVDGFCKIVIMLSIIVFCKELDLTPEELNDATLRSTLESFASISCSYSHYTHPGHHYLHSLRTLNLTFVNVLIFFAYLGGVEITSLILQVMCIC